ncbi:hypothetical protein PUR61_36700, partial [Streptomyces sp. BE20]|nr:hypothetical protein [Streptomyces sp. BE20]
MVGHDSTNLTEGVGGPRDPEVLFTPGDVLTDLVTPQEQTRAVQRFLSETFVIARQEPQNPRGLLVMPPRDLTATNSASRACGRLRAISASLIMPTSSCSGWLITGSRRTRYCSNTRSTCS